jgi:hypothetical protein
LSGEGIRGLAIKYLEILLFLFKVISAYLNTLHRSKSFKNNQQRPPKEQHSVQPSVFTVGQRKESADARSGEQGGWLISTTLCLARNIFTASAEWEAALSCKKNQLPSALNCGLDNLNAESTIDCLPFRHKLFMNHTLFVKKCDQHGFNLGLLQTKLLGPRS